MEGVNEQCDCPDHVCQLCVDSCVRNAQQDVAKKGVAGVRVGREEGVLGEEFLSGWHICGAGFKGGICEHVFCSASHGGTDEARSVFPGSYTC